jgi:predicted RNase H-like HicB family nuclease
MTDYLVIYETGDDGGWGASSPDLPGCVAVGETRAEVEKLIAEAIPMHIAAMREIGEPIPVPHHLAGSVSA